MTLRPFARCRAFQTDLGELLVQRLSPPLLHITTLTTTGRGKVGDREGGEGRKIAKDRRGEGGTGRTLILQYTTRTTHQMMAGSRGAQNPGAPPAHGCSQVVASCKVGCGDLCWDRERCFVRERLHTPLRLRDPTPV